MSLGPRILLVEDEVNMARTLAKNLERAGYVVEHAAEGQAALARLAEEPFDVVITDLKMPGMDGMTLLRELSERRIAVAAIVLTGFGTIETAVEAMKLGAADYLIKDARPQEVLLTLERVLRFQSLRRENERLRAQLRRSQGFGELIGVSAPMRDIYRLVEAVSQNKSTVLVLGESGTGKELVARTIHERSALRDGPFVAVNCAGLAETLLDSQLFGHRRGAFTGAVADHDGVFRAASGGTLFLDEVAEIPIGLQAKFLRAIQEREVVPLGSTRAIPVDVRLIAATNRDIEAEVDAGRFRRDLFYRLNVVRIELPPLRARLDDVPVLVEHFVTHYSQQYGVAPKAVTPDALACLQAYDWPGNVRELQNVVERTFALSDADTITLADLPASVRRPESRSPAGRPPGARQTLDDTERELIAETLSASGGNKNEAARRLGIDRQRLYRKLRKYGLA
ncbi:MAG TPA: sigma-54 dependent transcriptional regulator [Candidatus Limnocylindria bacterium]|nr:sigma-54 dependent transcriptional regulator [Candidatus Limnocylindria bacterium]